MKDGHEDFFGGFVNKDGDRAYSSYFEVSAPFTLGGCDWTATVGAVPFASSFYADANGFAVTNSLEQYSNHPNTAMNPN